MEQTITGGTYTTNEFPTKEINDEFKKRVEKYLKLSHQTLAEMLALRDEEESKQNSESDCPLQPNQPYTPYYPYYPYHPYTPINTKWCPISMAECNNPFGDCINCPYHGGVSYGTKYTTTCTANLDGDANSAEQKDNDRLSFAERLKKSNLV